jgi:hypothetical protein
MNQEFSSVNIRKPWFSMLMYHLGQGWAKYGPLRGSMRPAEDLENVKKNEVSKNICANIIKPSKMKAE